MTFGQFQRAAARLLVVSGALVAPTLSAQDQRPAPPTSAAQPAPAGDAIRLTVEDAVRRAIDHNPDLAVVKLGTDVEAERVGEADAAYRPVFSTVFGRSAITVPSSSPLTGEAGFETSDLFASTGIRQRLRWGSGTYSVSWDAARTSTNSLFSTFEPSLQSGLQMAFSQPLLRDRKMDSARLQTVTSQRNLKSADLRVRESTVQTTAAVKQAYWTLKAAMANVTVQQRSLELAEDLVRQNRARVNVGQAPPLDLVQAEAEVATRRENLIRAGATAGDAEDRLRRLIMDPADAAFWGVRLEPIDEPAGAVAPPNVNQAIGSALRERYDLAVARNELENARTNISFFENQKLPDVRLEASYRSGGAGGTQLVRTGEFPGTITGRLQSGFGDVLGQMFSYDYPTWSVGVRLNYPIGRSFEEAGHARAEIEHRQSAHRIASLESRIAETVRQAARQVQSTAERVDASRAGQTLAEQRLSVEQRRFEAGLSTTFLVTQAQRDLLQAQVNVLQAMLDHQSSLITFDAVQLAPAATDTTAIGPSGTPVSPLPTLAPQGIFRAGGGL
ncbi:MAG TPA: TolC family protein [Vicinamibacterales bacterium]|nr:TolC family protein [Vicinamibacterales bacterium]